jgi:hypothetical protein
VKENIRVLFTQKNVTEISKTWIWDPEKTYSGSRGQKGIGSLSGSETLAMPHKCKGYFRAPLCQKLYTRTAVLQKPNEMKENQKSTLTCGYHL